MQKLPLSFMIFLIQKTEKLCKLTIYGTNFDKSLLFFSVWSSPPPHLPLGKNRTPSNYGDEMISSTCALNVAKGEEAPKLTPVAKVNGVAHKECNWGVPYKVRRRRRRRRKRRRQGCQVLGASLTFFFVFRWRESSSPRWR